MGSTFAIGNDGAVSTPDATDLALAEAPLTRRAKVVATSGMISSLLIAALTAIPSPYAIGRPGPTFDALERVSIEGAPTYESSGELRLTTVTESAGSSMAFTVGQVITAFFSPSRTVVPEEKVFGTDDDKDAQQQASTQQWVTSQEAAAVSALKALGEDVPVTLTVAGVDEASAALGVLEAGDVIVGLEGKTDLAYEDLSGILGVLAPGDVVNIVVLRDGEELAFDVPLIDGGQGRGMLGIWVDPIFDMPIDVEVGIDSVGGPSAGMMFALAIMDLLTSQDELGGAAVAGSGTIDAFGNVGPIGGIQLKMAGARAAGAEYFLAPIDNCDEVVGHVPAGLNVYAVNDLNEAYEVIVAIGQADTASLPTCTQMKDEA